MSPVTAGGAPSDATCWCCGGLFDQEDLTRLGEHPEVALCPTCAQWVHRRSRAAADRGRRTPGALLRAALARAREAAVESGVADRPVVGPILRRVDRHLP